ncbi:hypothetical protein D9611_009761 [Ephemerocybe angulata]|uniref:Uncharacterized protein n=1 Tax=Ephemerocybe angulata TaxID=980116 RepID=A0A8H5FJD3_9AGAR|nr:hypothetical protein D9611_009761 [Tulosesus angulatus]
MVASRSDSPQATHSSPDPLSSCFEATREGVDTVLQSMNQELYHVQASAMREVAKAAFSTASETGGIIEVPEQGDVLHNILHALHRSPCERSSGVSLDSLVTAVDHMHRYGITPRTLILPRTSYYDLLLSHSKVNPLSVYSLAGHHELHDLAVESSRFLLELSPTEIPDEAGKRMGVLYLKRILVLHTQVIQSLKRLLMQPPEAHAPIEGCDEAIQKALRMDWDVVASGLAWTAGAGASAEGLRSELLTLEATLNCEECKNALHRRVQDVSEQWANVKRTI